MNRTGILWPDGWRLDLRQLELLFIYAARHPGSSIVITPFRRRHAQ